MSVFPIDVDGYVLKSCPIDRTVRRVLDFQLAGRSPLKLGSRKAFHPFAMDMLLDVSVQGLQVDR